MVTIATFGGPQAADFARTRLEAAGIEVFCPDNVLASFLSGEGPLVGGIRLQVSEDDAAEARRILEAMRTAEDSPHAPDPGSPGESGAAS